VLSLGARYRVTRAGLFRVLGISEDSTEKADRKPESAAVPPVATAGLPEGGVPVVLVLQAVLLTPGTLRTSDGTATTW
jgi:hypothetical protein